MVSKAFECVSKAHGAILLSSEQLTSLKTYIYLTLQLKWQWSRYMPFRQCKMMLMQAYKSKGKFSFVTRHRNDWVKKLR